MKMGASPVWTVAIISLWELLAYGVQHYTLGRLTDYSFSDYFQKVLRPTLLVIVLVGLSTYWFNTLLNDSIPHLILLCCVSCPLSLLLSYILLLNHEERQFVKRTIKTRLSK